jgi:hypothetical protein
MKDEGNLDIDIVNSGKVFLWSCILVASFIRQKFKEFRRWKPEIGRGIILL